MKLLAYARLLSRRINSADRRAQNPFVDYESSLNPFSRPLYSTLVWVEPEDNAFQIFKKY